MAAFLRNFMGFFIQFYPCALMIFLPFPRESYRFERRRIFVCVTLATAIAAALFPLALYRTAPLYTATTANVYMFSAILLMLSAYLWLVRERPMKKILVFFIVMFYAALQYCLVNSLNGFLSEVVRLPSEYEKWAVYTSHGLLLYIITAIILLPPMLIFIIRLLSEYINRVETHNMRREFFIVIISTIVFIAMMICVDFSYYYIEYKLYLLMLILFLVLLLYQIMIYWLVFWESVRRERENKLRRTMEIQQIQYEKIIADMENTRRQRHDMRHHYNSINDMLERGKLDEMKDYLAKLIDATAKRDSEMYCKNMTVNGLLQYYIGLARDSGIRCDVRAECGDLNIEPVDLTVLFANTMENAVNSCNKCSENPRITVKIGTIHGSLAIEIANSCKSVRLNRRFQNDDGFSPAEAFLSGSENGGYGLRSISYTARKYGGSAKFRFDAEKELFITRIRLNINDNI